MANEGDVPPSWLLVSSSIAAETRLDEIYNFQLALHERERIKAANLWLIDTR